MSTLFVSVSQLEARLKTGKVTQILKVVFGYIVEKLKIAQELPVFFEDLSYRRLTIPDELFRLSKRWCCWVRRKNFLDAGKYNTEYWVLQLFF